MQPVVSELSRRQWPNKRRVTSKGNVKGGRPFDKGTLHVLLTNPILAGKIAYKDQIYQGEHEPVIAPEVFDRVQQQLRYNGRTGGIEVRNRYGALLRGLLRCKHCDAAMTHTFTGGHGKPFYRYYRCIKAIKTGAHVCPATTLPAAEMERVVVDEIRALGRDRGLLDRVLSEARLAADAELAALRRERDELKGDLSRRERELKQLVTDGSTARGATERLAAVHERITDARQRLPELEKRFAELEGQVITREEAQAALRDFDGVWNNLIPREQARLLKLVFAAVEWDARASSVSVTFRPTGISALCRRRTEEAACGARVRRRRLHGLGDLIDG